MKADYSRLQFNLDKNYTRVLQQQGRVTLDADWNEHVTIQAELDRKRLIDIIGGCGVPINSAGFRVIPTADGTDLQILPGVIYLDGMRVQLDAVVNYSNQPFLPNPPDLPAAPAEGEDPRTDLVYICATERHITHLEDEDIREIALGGPDTGTRVQTIWQVGVATGVNLEHCEEDFSNVMPPSIGKGRLTTETTPPSIEDDPCVTPADSGYRGLENRLYRIEVHQSGAIAGAVSIKWSRYNGAVAFSVVPDGINAVTRTIRLTRLGWDQIRTLKKNDLIEIVSEADELNGVPGAIVQIDDGTDAVDEAQRQIIIRDLPAYNAALTAYRDQDRVKVRLWDGEITLADKRANATRTNPIELEDGIRITLSVASAADQFRSGDYWTFTARTITGRIDILNNEPPHGPTWHCCKLALIHWGGEALVVANEESFDPGLITEWAFLEAEREWAFRVDTARADVNALALRLREIFRQGDAPANLVNGLNLGDTTLRTRRSFAADFFTTRGDLLIVKFSENDNEFLRTMLGWFAELEGTFIEDCRPIFPPLTELINLYYVTGDGQEAFPGEVLPSSLIVRINRGEHPAPGVPVVFELVDPTVGGRVFPELPPGSIGGDRVVVYSDALGFAQVRWELGTDRDKWSQQVVAYIDAPGDIRKHLQVGFNANLSIAERVSYVPPDDCRNLAGSTTVAEALNKLCDIGIEDDPGFHVDGLFWQVEAATETLTVGDVVVIEPAPNGAFVLRLNDLGRERRIRLAAIAKRIQPLLPAFTVTVERTRILITPLGRIELPTVRPVIRPGARLTLPDQIARIPLEVAAAAQELPARHDTDVEMPLFVRGMRIHCDQPPDPDTIKQASVFMRMEVPFGDANLPTIYLDYIIPGDVTANGEDIFWRPSAAAAEVLLNLSSQLEARARLITRLTLKGSNIWQSELPDVYLDGEVTSTPDGATPHNLNLPSGNGKRGGDFETWFNVITSEPEVTPTDDFFVAGVLHPATMIGVSTTRIVNGTVQVVNPGRINQRLDALNQGYDHQAAVDGLDNYTPSDTPFDPDLARELLASSELQTDGLTVLVVIQQEFQDLGVKIVEQWLLTFRELGLEFQTEIVPAVEMVDKLPELININIPASIVLCDDQLFATLDSDATLGQFFAAEFTRRV